MGTLTDALAERGIRAEFFSHSPEDPLGTDLETHKEYIKGLEKFKGSGLNASLRTAYDTFPNWLTNKLFHRKIGNPRSLDYLDSSEQDVVFALHGLSIPFLHENGRGFNKLVRQAKEEGYTVVPISYNDNQDFDDYVTDAHDNIKRLMDSAKHSPRFYAIGHSTGGDVVRAINADEGFNEFTGLVMAAPAANGKVPNFLDKYVFFRNKTDYHNPDLEEENRIDKLQTPLFVPGITINYWGDAFIKFTTSYDTTGDNLVLEGSGHLTGIASKRGNIAYIETLNELKRGTK